MNLLAKTRSHTARVLLVSVCVVAASTLVASFAPGADDTPAPGPSTETNATPQGNVLFGPERIHHSSLLLEVNVTGTDNAKILLRIEDADEGVIPWYVWWTVYNATGAEIGVEGLGQTAPADREVLAIRHGDQDHKVGPNEYELWQSVPIYEDIDAAAENLIEVQPGTNNLVLLISHFGATVTVETTAGYEDVVTARATVDPSFDRRRLTGVAGDWDEVSTEVWTTSRAGGMVVARTSEYIKSPKGFIEIYAPFSAYFSLEIAHENGLTCTSEALLLGDYWAFAHVPTGNVTLSGTFALNAYHVDLPMIHYRIREYPFVHSWGDPGEGWCWPDFPWDEEEAADRFLAKAPSLIP